MCCEGGPVLLVLVGYLIGAYAIVFGYTALSSKTVRLWSLNNWRLRGRTAVYCGYACIAAGTGLVGWITLVVALFPAGLGHHAALARPSRGRHEAQA